MADQEFTLQLEQLDQFEYKIKFDKDSMADLLMDEPEPLGGGKGPNPTRLIGAAVAYCLSASLFFCLQKSRVEVKGIKASVTGRAGRNEQKRLRIQGFDVRITLPDEVAANRAGIERCLGLFEDYCVATASIRSGIPVGVEVTSESGTSLHKGGH